VGGWIGKGATARPSPEKKGDVREICRKGRKEGEVSTGKRQTEKGETGGRSAVLGKTRISRREEVKYFLRESLGKRFFPNVP